MPGLIFTSPGAFTSPEALPTVSVRRVEPLPGALSDWAADRLPDGGVTSWTDLTGTAQLLAPNSGQAGIAENGVVRFNGTNQRAETPLVATRPLTMVLVARAPSPVGAYRFFASASGFTFGFGSNAAGDRWTIYGDGNNLGSSVAPDSNWHVFVIVANGANSVISVDGIENNGDMGNLGTGANDVLRMGGYNAGYHASEIRRFAILPYAANADERSIITDQLATHYGVS